jgi:hypothetical protein
MTPEKQSKTILEAWLVWQSQLSTVRSIGIIVGLTSQPHDGLPNLISSFEGWGLVPGLPPILDRSVSV